MSFGQSAERIGINHHTLRLLESTYCVFDAAEVDSRLSADRGIHLGEQGGRHVVEVDASHIYRCGKAREVAYDTAADRYYTVAASESGIRHCDEHRLKRGEALRGLALIYGVDRRRLARALNGICILSGHAAVGDDEDPAIQIKIFVYFSDQSLTYRYWIGSLAEIHAERDSTCGRVRVADGPFLVRS